MAASHRRQPQHATTTIKSPKSSVLSVTPPSSSYGVDSIQIFKGLDGIRKRPSMYLGDTGDSMVFQMLKEIVDNSVDEYQAGRNSYVAITVNNQHQHSDDNDDFTDIDVIVYDKGHGVPTGYNEKEKINTLTAVFSMVHAGGKFDASAYKSSAGTFGTGSSAVNAVSYIFEVWTFWHSAWYYQRFEQGKATTNVLKQNPPASITQRIVGFSNKRGTIVHFVPDQTVVAHGNKPAKLNLNQVVDYLKTLSYLNSKLELIIRSETHNKNLRFYTENGIKELLDSRVESNGLEYATPKVFNLVTPNLSLALSWTNYDGEDGLWSYVNSSRTIDGGKHIDGLFAAYQKAISDFVSKEASDAKQDKVAKTSAVIKMRGKATNNRKSRLQSSLDKISLRDLKVGLLGILNLKMSGAVYSSQTKEKLTSDVAKSVENDIYPKLTKFFADNPQVIKTIINRAKTIAQGRDQFKQVMKSLTSMKKSGSLFLPNILVSAPDATPDTRELYCTEGLSALGNCKKSRDSSFQEVMALSGKVANAHRLQLAKLLASTPVRNLILSLGADVDAIKDAESGTFLATDNLRVKNVIVLADQDPDGFHISVLVLTLLWRFFPDLYKEGRVFVVDAKLYHAAYKGQYYFGDTFDECYQQLPSGASKNLVVRAKGLAEYSVDVLSHIAFNPATRSLLRINPPKDAHGVGYFERLVGSDSAERKVLLGL